MRVSLHFFITAVDLLVKIEFEYPDNDEMMQMFALFYHWMAIGVLIGYVTRSSATCTDVNDNGFFLCSLFTCF